MSERDVMSERDAVSLFPESGIKVIDRDKCIE